MDELLKMVLLLCELNVIVPGSTELTTELEDAGFLLAIRFFGAPGGFHRYMGIFQNFGRQRAYPI